MKIEIDYKEVEEIKERNRQLEKSVRDLEAQLMEYNKNTIEKKINKTAEKMFQAVMHRVCLELHIDYDRNIMGNQDFLSLTRTLGKSWWNSDKLSINPFMWFGEGFKKFLISFTKIEDENSLWDKEEEDYDFKVKSNESK